MFEVKLDTSQWDDFVKSYEKNFSKSERERILNEAAAYIDFKILERTAKGVDVYGGEFIPYAPLTVRLRSEAGLPTKKVDLFWSGHMLNALTHDVKSEEGRVFFLPGGKPSATEKALKNNETRPFFGVNQDDRKAVYKIVEKAIDRIFK